MATFLNNLGEKLSKTGQRTMEKANNLADTTKMSLRTNEIHKILQEHYVKLGQRYYEIHGEAPEDELAAECGEIARLKAEQEQIRADWQRIKKIRICPGCGYENPSDASFCCKCSAALPELPMREESFKGCLCTKCGAQVPENAVFCTKCGSRIKTEEM